MYRNYIFDLYGTLVDIRTDEAKEELWNKMVMLYAFYGAHYTAKELEEEYKNYCEEEKQKVIANTNVKHPDIVIEHIFDRLFVEKGVVVSQDFITATAQMFRILSTSYLRLYDGVIDLLSELKRNNKKIYLLSNAQYVFTYYEMKSLGLIPYFDGIVISSNELCSKPDASFFDLILSRYDLKKEESIMIGNDLITDIKGAHDVGLKSLFIKSNITPEQDKITNYADYTILDGDVNKIKQMILKTL